jgi:hypothetical protein
MKHAGSLSLDALEPLLDELRTLDRMKERTRGVFYLRSKAFLHFHEDPAGLFADLRDEGGEFVRFPVNTAPERRRLLAAVSAMLAA